MKINVHVNYSDNTEILEKKAVDLLVSILIKKFTPKEIDELVEILDDNTSTRF